MKTKSLYIACVILVYTGCTSPKARKPVSQKSAVFYEASIERNKRLYARETALIQKKIAANPSVNYIHSPKGFWYYHILKDTTGTLPPAKGDVVVFEYEISDLNGRLIYSKDDLGEKKYVIDQEEIIRGIAEGLKLMKKGEKTGFIFPSYNAYGYHGDNKAIGSNLPIHCIITLKEIFR